MLLSDALSGDSHDNFKCSACILHVSLYFLWKVEDISDLCGKYVEKMNFTMMFTHLCALYTESVMIQHVLVRFVWFCFVLSCLPSLVCLVLSRVPAGFRAKRDDEC